MDGMHNDMVTYDEFAKLDIRIGKICSAERVPDTDKLLKLEVDVGEKQVRQVVSGIAEFFPDPQELVGKHCPFLVNLEPRIIRGLESQAMILAANSSEGGGFSLLHPDRESAPGNSVR